MYFSLQSGCLSLLTLQSFIVFVFQTMFNIKTQISTNVSSVREMRRGVGVRFGTEDDFFGDPFYDVVVEGEPFAVEFGVVYVVTFMDVCADVGDDCEEVVCAVSVVGLVGDG